MIESLIIGCQTHRSLDDESVIVQVFFGRIHAYPGLCWTHHQGSPQPGVTFLSFPENGLIPCVCVPACTHVYPSVCFSV